MRGQDDSALLSSRVLNGADVERLKRLLREKDAEVRQLREHFDHELQAAMDGREVEVRRQIVEEIQKRKENGESEESQVRVMIEGIKKTYEMMVATAESSLKTELREKDAKIEELNRMITDLNDDVLRLQSLYDLVTSSRRGRGLMRRRLVRSQSGTRRSDRGATELLHGSDLFRCFFPSHSL